MSTIKLFYTNSGPIIAEVVEVDEPLWGISGDVVKGERLKNPCVIQMMQDGKANIMPMTLASAADQSYTLNHDQCVFGGGYDPLPALVEKYRQIFSKVQIAPANALAGLTLAKR